jgi:hypothetical protein
MTLLWTISLMILSLFQASFIYIFIWYSFFQIVFTCLFFMVDATFRIFVAKGAIYKPIQTDPSDKDITKSSGAKTKSYMYLFTENKIYWMFLPLLTLIPCIISMDLFFRISAAVIGILSKIGGFADLTMAFAIGISTCFLFLSYLPSNHFISFQLLSVAFRFKFWKDFHSFWDFHRVDFGFLFFCGTIFINQTINCFCDDKSCQSIHVGF